MTDEDRLIELLRDHRELTARIEQLSVAPTPADLEPQAVLRAELEELREQQRSVANELIVLLEPHLRHILAGWRNKLYRDGVQFTEIVHDFFLKLLEDRAGDFWNSESEPQLLGFVKQTLHHQVCDFFREQKREDRAVSAITPFVEQRQSYYEARFDTTYEQFVCEYLTQWERSGNEELMFQALILQDHYIGGMKWGDLARQHGISDERLTMIRRRAYEQLKKKLSPSD